MKFLESIKDLFTNYCLMSAVFGWLIAQFLKVLFGIFKVREFSIKKLLFGNGGMPSSHMAAVSALLLSSGLKEGFNSTYFAIAGVLSAIVWIDATGVRQETGKQAVLLNKILKEGNTEVEQPTKNKDKLEEFVGHTPLQAFFGVITGFCVAIIFYFIPCFV